jgi:hypothetical protein
MESVSSEDLENAKRSLEIWRKAYNIETNVLTEELKKTTGGSKKRRKSRKNKRI